MIPNLVFILYTIGWAKTIQYGIESSEFMVAAAMLLPFLVLIIPLLLFGLHPPANFLAL